MPIDLTPLEPPGLQLHIRVNSLLFAYGFLDRISSEQKLEFDLAFEKIIKDFLPYEDE